jgi:hypothetical protein
MLSFGPAWNIPSFSSTLDAKIEKMKIAEMLNMPDFFVEQPDFTPVKRQPLWKTR